VYCLLMEGSSMERRKIDLPDYFICLMQFSILLWRTHCIGNAFAFWICGELSWSTSLCIGRCRQDVVNDNRHLELMYCVTEGCKWYSVRLFEIVVVAEAFVKQDGGAV
jgi:hypothetical protein